MQNVNNGSSATKLKFKHTRNLHVYWCSVDSGLENCVPLWFYFCQFRRVQYPLPSDYAISVRSCESFNHGYKFCLTFCVCVDEAAFTRDGITKAGSFHPWARENPHRVTRFVSQQRCSVNVWCWALGNNLIGLRTCCEGTLNSSVLQTFTGKRTASVFSWRASFNVMYVTASWKGTSIFRHRGNGVFLNETCKGRWIGRRPVAWPARSHDWNPFDFILWGCMKSSVSRWQTRRKASVCRDHKWNRCWYQQRMQLQHSAAWRQGVCIQCDGGHFERVFLKLHCCCQRLRLL